jgi:signal transduction histidine kinase
VATADGRGRIGQAIENAMAHLDEALFELDRLPAFDPSAIGFVAQATDSYLTVNDATLDLLADALRDHPNAEVRTWLEGLRHLAGMIHHTVGRLVRVASPGDFPLKPDYIDLPRLMQRACDYFQRQAREKPLKILCRSVGDVPPAWADRVAVAVVVDNLLANAVQVSDPGAEILVQTTPGPGGVVCSVRDRGPGLSPSDQATLLSRGVGAGAGARPAADEPPEGFGLAIAKELVDRMNGRLWVESELGKGSSFSFRLPYHPAEEGP